MKKLCHSSVLSFCSPLLKASNMKKFLSLNFKKSFTHSLKNTSGTHLKSVKIRNEQKRKSFKRRQHFIRKLLKHFPHHNGYILEFDSSDFTVHCYLLLSTFWSQKGMTYLSMDDSTCATDLYGRHVSCSLMALVISRDALKYTYL